MASPTVVEIDHAQAEGAAGVVALRYDQVPAGKRARFDLGLPAATVIAIPMEAVMRCYDLLCASTDFERETYRALDYGEMDLLSSSPSIKFAAFEIPRGHPGRAYLAALQLASVRLV